MGLTHFYKENKCYVAVLCVLILVVLLINESLNCSDKSNTPVITRYKNILNASVNEEKIVFIVKADDKSYPRLSKSNGIKIFRYYNGSKFEYNSYNESLPATSTHRNSEGKLNLFLHIDDNYGLGNRMFMYASGYAIAKRTNRTFYFKSNVYTFNLFSKSVDALNILTDGYLNIQMEKCCEFELGLFDLPKENILLHPYLQSWKFFSDYEQDIRQQFVFKDSVLNEAEKYLSNIRSNHTKKKIIGLHIRRGDMLEHHFVVYGMVVADKPYLDRAIRHFKKKYECIFIVCSNGMVWAKRALENHKSYVVFSEGRSAQLDIAILSLTDHMIITVGSYGWWAAYLNNGSEVVYFKNWPKKGSTFDYYVNKADYFPSHWTGL